MASKDDLLKTGEPGVFYREHPTRKNGVRKDRQRIVIQKLGGVRRVSTLGWWYDGITIGDAINKAHEYKTNFKLNRENPNKKPLPICKQDENDAADELADQIERQRKANEYKNVTFSDYFIKTYKPLQIDNGKSAVTIKREQALFEYHLKSVLGGMSFPDIKPIHIERVKKNMADKKQSPRSIQYCLAVFRQVWNQAVRDDVTELSSPAKDVKIPKVNNQKDRFFTEEEEALLLAELAKRSSTTHDMAIMSLDTGARWSELAKLKWTQVNLTAETVRFIDTKAGDDRTAHIATKRVLEMLKRRQEEEVSKPEDEVSVYVFPARDLGAQTQVNRVCFRTIKELGFNKGVDSKHRLSFHSFRHTCASRLAMAGVPLYTIKEVLGHHTITTTERYAHLMPSAMREALETLEIKPAEHLS
ncbi:MAG: site-specific integrase [Kiritimatiellae bacterium]|nr:site-specific integrase [Kiritimatiellia bacterium]